MIKTLLIANRGEIACRIMRTAKAQGITCVAIYSDADADALHVRVADVAIHIGGSEPSDSYLRTDRILDSAKQAGADAIHPGYGFLSENADFAQAVEDEGFIFVGPAAHSIRAMGLKDHAKTLMERADVPVVPGYHGENQDDQFLAQQADQIGFPIMIKAVAGGGGKGMRVVQNVADFEENLASARAEARAAFGNDGVLIEKFIPSPRHIEVQIFGDGTQAVHLYERDCSLQRRHQKVIEEAPAPGMTDAVRAAMGSAAVKAAQAVNYKGAGTVEFIVDGSGPLRVDGFWFMEMNTRLQVEHPVTEAICGVDLVDWQLRVAGGQPLPRAQNEIKVSGHAFEARICAEDPSIGFLPTIGVLSRVSFPGDARADSAVEKGDTITPYYDPMIAKVIVHGQTRDTALAALKRALDQTELSGIQTNLGFLSALAGHTEFSQGQVDTGLISRDLAALTAPPVATATDIAQAALMLARLMGDNPPQTGFALHAPLRRTVMTDAGGVVLSVLGAKAVDCELDDQTVHARKRGGVWYFDGIKARGAHCVGRCVTLFGAAPLIISAPDPFDRAKAGVTGNEILTPMPGLLRDVFVSVGDQVGEGDRLATLEAMKMEHVLRAPRAGKIANIQAAGGDQVQAGIALIMLEDPS